MNYKYHRGNSLAWWSDLVKRLIVSATSIKLTVLMTHLVNRLGTDALKLTDVLFTADSDFRPWPVQLICW